MRTVLCFLFSALALGAHACLWDRDAVREEAQENGSILAVLMGQAPRHPALYYEMRLERVEQALGENPDWALYDDAAVAHAKLGSLERALELTRRKIALLDASRPSPETQTHRARALANEATFLMMRALKAPPRVDTLPDLRAALDRVDEAVRSSPNDSFEGEWGQRWVLEWLIAYRGGQRQDLPPLSEFVTRRATEQGKTSSQIARAMETLIRRGEMATLPDIYMILARHLETERLESLGWVAEWRARALYRSGAYPLDPSVATELSKEGPPSHLSPRRISLLKNDYERLSSEIKRWQTDREAFMLARLREGRHPDTDPNFWTDSPESPVLALSEEGSGRPAWSPNWLIVPVLLLLIGLALSILRWVFRGLGRRASAPKHVSPPRHEACDRN